MPIPDQNGSMADHGATFDATLAGMGDEKFVRLSTFRKTGEPVHTAVWVVRDGQRLLVTTGADSGKVKRIRHTARVELTPCDRAGTARDNAPIVTATATIDAGTTTRARLDVLLLAKYGLLYRAIRAAAHLRGRNTSTALVITAD